MNRTSHLWMGLCLAAVPLTAQSNPRSPAAEVKALEAEYDASKLSYPNRFATYLPKFEAFAKLHRGTDSGLTAELWILSGCWWSRKDGTMNDKAGVIADRILEYYFHSKRLGELADRAYVFSAAQKESYFNTMLKRSKFDDVKAAAHLALGRLHYRSKDSAQRAAGIAHLRRLTKGLADVHYRQTTFGAMANALLAPHKPVNLSIGKPAPEIEGVGLDGKPMRLSDYRGKIVVLDFWGDW